MPEPTEELWSIAATRDGAIRGCFACRTAQEADELIAMLQAVRAVLAARPAQREVV